MRKILVATDFSVRSDRAVRRATLLAKEFDASLCLVHVVDDDQPEQLVEAEKQVAADLLADLSRSIRELVNLDCTYSVALGDAFEGITQSAEEMQTDLIVIGPHRRQTLKDVFVGTTAERTIRESNLPVLMANSAPVGRYGNALLTLDLSEYSAETVRCVHALGLEKKTGVSVLHVFDAPASGLMRRIPASTDEVNNYFTDEQKRVAALLKSLLVETGLHPTQHLALPKKTTIANTICTTVNDSGTDLVIVGTRSRTGLGKLLLGSVAEEILRIADFDVLAIPLGQKR